MLLKILKKLNEKSLAPIVAVGGCVRDLLIGKDPKDIDLLFLGNDIDLEKSLAGFNYKRIEPTSSFPIFSFKILGMVVEITIPRKEVKISGKNPHKSFDMIFSGNFTLEEDVLRRDFTVNAIAMDHNGNIIDPLNGKADLEKRDLVPCSKAFIEDPLRVFRALRFSCKGFRISNSLIDLINENKTELEEEINKLPMERLRMEFEKSLVSDNFKNFFYNYLVLDLHIENFDFIKEMSKIPAGPKFFHNNDSVLDHSIKVMENVKPENRLFALFHDYGKIFTPSSVLPRHIGHEIIGPEKVEILMKKLKFTAKDIKFASIIAGEHMSFGYYNEWKTTTKFKKISNILKSGCLDILIDVVSADNSDFTEKEILEIRKISDFLKLPVSSYIDFEIFDKKSKSFMINKIYETKISKIKEIIKNTP